MTGDNDSPQPPGDGQPQAGSSSNPPDFKGLSEAATQLAKNVTKAAQPFRELTDRLRDQFGQNPELSRFARQLAEQQKAIGRFRTPLSAEAERLISPEIKAYEHIIPEIPINPVVETNAKLDRIEQRFEEMQKIAANGAEIATGLQAYAADFLQKFETAAEANNRAARLAIRVGGLAIAATVTVALVQIGYSEWWRVPRDTAAAQQAIVEMRAEIEALRSVQADAAVRIEQAAREIDASTAEALWELIAVLREQREPDSEDAQLHP